MDIAEGTKRILVVEDEHDIATAIAERLRDSGYETEVALDGTIGLARAREWKPDLIVLDLMLPGVSGHEICRVIQSEQQTPVLMLTALTDETDVLVGLRVGADDYMTKPFSPRELVARVEAILRRATAVGTADPSVAGTLRFGTIEIDEPTRRVIVDGQDTHLTPTEFNLISVLVRADGAVLSRGDLLHRCWGYRDDAGARTVDSHIRALRRKLGDGLIRTVHGVGYGLAIES